MKQMNLEGWNVDRGFGFAKLREGGKIEQVYVQTQALCEDLKADAVAARVAKSVLGSADALAIAMVNGINGRDVSRKNPLVGMHRDAPVRIYGEVVETKQGLRANKVVCARRSARRSKRRQTCVSSWLKRVR